MSPPPVHHGDLSAFNDPETVTVVGASADPAKWGYWLARGALLGAHRRKVNLVNRRGVSIQGQRSISTLSGVEGPLGLVVVCVPPPAVTDAVREALDRGARAFLCITSGLDRALGRPGAEAELVQEIRLRGARIIGPNCLGIYDASTDLQLAWGEFTPGRLGIVSQSGQVGSELANLASDAGLGVSRFVSVGNQLDVTVAEALADLVDHQATAVVALYAEGFQDGRLLVETMRRLREVGKPVLLLTVGATRASRTAAASHTGALTSAIAVVDAACRAAGCVRVETPAQLVEVARMLVDAPPAAGPRVAIVADSGGQGAIAADVLSHVGMTVPRLGTQQQRALTRMLHPEAGVANPIDLAGAGEADMGVYAETIEALLADDDVDAVTMTGYFGSYGVLTPHLQDQESGVALRIAEASAKYSKPVALHSMCKSSKTLALVRDHGVPTFHAIEHAALSLATSARLANQKGRTVIDPTDAADPLPAPGYFASRSFLERAGARFPAAATVTTANEVTAAAANLRSPYVLKADWVTHKTELGAVAVGLQDQIEALAAFETMSARLGPGIYVLEEMDIRPDVVEMIVGVRRDPVFGPLVMVGAGGVHAELYRDIAIELAPVDQVTAAGMLRRLRSFALLQGWRGRPPVDVDGLARLVSDVSGLLQPGGECAEIELNPVRVGTDGAVAVDALVTTEASPGQHE